MGIGGRKPKPAETRRLEGNRGKRPIKDGPDFSPGDSLAPPKRWPAKGYEREEWNRIVPELVKAKIAKAGHQGLLEKICEQYAASVELYERRDYTGSRMAAEAYRKALCEVGLTPATASRVTATGDNGDSDPAAKYFTGPQAVNS